MPDARLQRTRETYRCGRSFVLIGWKHCDCRACAFANKANRAMREGITPAVFMDADRAVDLGRWLVDPEVAVEPGYGAGV